MKKNCSDRSFSINSSAKSSNIRIKGILLILTVFLTQIVIAQPTKEVSGVVTEAATGSPIPGVSVIVKGTTRGSATDLDGKFTLDVMEDDILVISFIGFKSQEIPVAGKTTIDVPLEQEVELFDEVVVVGYGVQKKKLVTGATIQVDGDKLRKRNTTSALQALQGQTPGVQISSTSGQPGEGLKVVVRGLGTIGNSGPLYVVDGVQTGDISYLNNADIESIDVLKDAASAAIYGSQAANGVVLITTKSGAKGKAQISFDAYYGYQNAARKVDLLNSREYAVIMNETAINSGKLPYFSASEVAAMGEGTDWMDEMLYDNAVTQNYNLGINGGNDASTYSMSLSYTGQEGIVGGPSVSNYDRYNFRINTEHKLYDGFLKIGQHLTFGHTEKKGISVGDQYNNTLRSAFNTSPFLPMYDDEGNYLNNTAGAGVMHNGEEWVPWAPGENNPYASMVLNNQSKNNNQKIFGDIYLEINPITNLTYKTTFGVDFYTSEGRSYKPAYELSIYAFRLHDEASQNLSKGLALTWDNILTYNYKLNDHSLTAMAGTSAYRNRGSSVYVTNSDLILSDLEHAYIDNTTNTDLTLLSYGGSPFDESMLLSYFGRLSYNFQEKYLLNATFRRDGSSRFDKEHRWGNFPSVSAGWVVTNESFMGTTQNWMDFLKIRASWGQVGNQNISAWQYLAPIIVGEGYRDGDNNVVNGSNYYFGSADFDASGNSTGAYPSRLANENLVWETSEQTNIGFDARFIDTKLGINFDWYNKRTKDWLLEAPILATAGAEAPFINGGNVKNSGIELALNWNDNIGKFNYFISGNISKNKNEVTEVPTDDGIVHGLTNMLYDNALEFYHRAETGYPIGYFWGWKTDGIFQNEAEVNAYTGADGELIQPSARPGDLRYIDIDNNGVINEDDKTMIGDPNPDYTFGFTFGFDYKGLDFSLSANGVAGNQLVQSYRNQANAFANYTTEILDRWHGEGTSTTIPRVTETNVNYLFSDIFIKDGDFLRISNITLGYDFSKLIRYNYLSQFRLYASVQNAFTFTKYNGMDPEIGYGVENGSSGVDLGYYPRPRTILLGVNIKF
ncbi:SusC/RagA family TonB-linked outer membrane protein [Maribellus comscasis]|uniref:SusC/RagA family TonB-linked outer membrane protein n=1 Tax=Maribellus comscasis TaxID=2681766 RepID=A0A6I6JRN2_9BACT|nr:TonB-dependent receptor [Maribellus comscasis]QGY45081.1 SusC/RagA family TonB-linked outer membrane protein [Maribellus comscasis]